MERQVKNFFAIIKYAIHNVSSTEIPKLQEPVEWEVLAEIFEKHNLFALFHEIAYKIPEYRQYSNYERNAQRSLIMVVQQIRKTEIFLNLYRAFLEEDIHPIVMKGIICRQLYGEYAEHRPSGDEDILVQKSDFYKVKTAMEKQGFVCSQPGVTEAQLGQLQEVGFYEKRSGFLIEVHTNIMGHENAMRTQMGECFRDVFKRAQTLDIHGVPITTMSHTDHFLFLVLHAFKHFTLSGVGVRQMLDILLYQETFEEEIDWKLVKNALEMNRADTYLGDLQSNGVKYLGLDLKEKFKVSSPEILLEDMMETGVFGKREETDIIAAHINLGAMDKKITKISTLFQVGFPNKNYMLTSVPYLEEKPWLLPIEWVKRWGRFLKRAKKYEGNLIEDSIKKSEKRKRLLKKYGI